MIRILNSNLKYTVCFIIFLLIGCKSEDKTSAGLEDSAGSEDSTVIIIAAALIEEEVIDYPAEEWMEITTENSGIILDIKYATPDNFTKKIIYDCARCFMRPEIAEKLIALNKGIMDRYKLKLKIFDGYRPRPAQQKLWDIVPDARYVTPPSRGSMHNRGMAVDISLVGMDGGELDMGTPYDFFGRAAHTDHNDLPSEVLENRNLLQSMLREIGFKTIRTEWWHFSYEGELYPLSDWVWECL